MIQPLPLTRHAERRRQQRGIAPYSVELLLRFGAVMRHNGADTLYLDKAGRKSIRREFGGKLYARLADQLDIYAMLGDDGWIITLAHRRHRLKRP